MSTVNLDRARLFHEAIRTALREEWDPIGVRDFPEAKDEYEAYVPQIYKMLIHRQPMHDVFDYLWWLETKHMGLTGDRQATEHFAERLMGIREEIEKRLREVG